MSEAGTMDPGVNVRIRRYRAMGYSPRRIAELFSVSISYVLRVLAAHTRSPLSEYPQPRSRLRASPGPRY